MTFEPQDIEAVRAYWASYQKLEEEGLVVGAVVRPPVPFDDPPLEWTAVPDIGPGALVWTIVQQGESKPCRWGGRNPCRRPSVAILDRGRVTYLPWHYCELHLYGRWIEDGQVMSWRVVR